MPNWKRSVSMAAVATVCALSTANVNTHAWVHAATSNAVIPGYGVENTKATDKSAADAGGIDIAKQARSAVIMDAATGKVLYEKDSHEELPMASITKIMTMLLTIEAIDDGRLKWTDQIKTSEHAASMGGSQIFLEPGETMSVRDMVKGIAVASANDACVAVAEHLDGSEEAFVAKMNKRAQELGADDTHFSNCNGLPAANHYSSAHDIAIMSRALLSHPEITQFTSVYSDYLRKNTDHPLWLVNTNKLVRFYDGVDGLKTGFTQEAKYCLSATAKKEGFRVIAVVMGEPKPKVRNAEVTSMLNWAFSHYTSKVLYTKGRVVGTVRVSKGVQDRVEVLTAEPVGFVTERGAKANYKTEFEWKDVKAPVLKGSTLGTMKVLVNGEVVGQVPLIAKETVKKANVFQSFGRTIKKIVTFGAVD